MGRIIGLDVGIGSLGWAVIDETNRRIDDLGVRIFESGEEGASKAADRASQIRRASRAKRRLNKRCKQRKNRLRKILEENEIITSEEINRAYRTKGFNADIWRYRSEGLKRKLEPIELASILINFANYRGYQDFYEDSEEDNEGKLTSAKNRIIQLFEEKKGKYVTIGNMIYSDSTFRNPTNGDLIIRNRGRKDSNGKKATDYKYLIDRKYLLEEADILLNRQCEFGFEQLKPDTISVIQECIFKQRDFEEGPGPRNDDPRRDSMLAATSGQQKYTGFDELIGYCPFYPNEKRGNRNSQLYDMYVLINTLSQFEFYNSDNRPVICPSIIIDEVRSGLFENDGVYKKKDFDQLCKKYGVTVCYTGDFKSKKNLISSPFIKVLTNKDYFTEELINQFKQESYMDGESLSSKIGYVLAKYVTPRRRKDELSLIIDSEEFKAMNYAKSLKVCKAESGANVSFKYMREAIEAYLSGVRYGDFQAKFLKNNSDEHKYNYLNDNGKLNPILDPDMMRNPVVYRSINEVRKIVNAITSNYKDISAIHVEVARDLGKSFEQRKEVTSIQKKNEESNSAIKEDLINKLSAEGYSVTLSDKLFEKYKLWVNQEKICLYSGEAISFEQLLEPTAVQVDHIIPQSIILDDTLNNKVLVLTKHNQDKGNKIPLQYLHGDDAKSFKNRVENLYRKHSISKIKREYLLLSELTDEVITGFVDRNINDTRMISKYISNYLRVAFDGKYEVNVIRGAITSKYRQMWFGRSKEYEWLPSIYGLEKKTRDLHYYHHAIDAVVVANLSRPYIEVAQDYLKLTSIRKDISFHEAKGNVKTSSNLEDDYHNELAKAIDKMQKTYGFSRDYSVSLLTSGRVPSICEKLREEVEVRVPLNIDVDIRGYVDMCQDVKNLRYLVKSILMEYDESASEVEGYTDAVNPDVLDEINALISRIGIDKVVCMKSNAQIIKTTGSVDNKLPAVIAKELKDFYKKIEEKSIAEYIRTISMYSEEEYASRVATYYDDQAFVSTVKMPYVSFKISRKFSDGYLSSDNPVSLSKTGFNTYKELEDDMHNNLKSPYYVRFNKGIGEDGNFTIYDARSYYCLEVYIDDSSKYQIRGIRYVDLYRDRPSGKLVLKKPLPQQYIHKCYIFKNEYIRVTKNGKVVNNGLGAYRSVENINHNTIKMRLYSNKNLSNRDVYIPVYDVAKLEISILGHCIGESTCGDQSLFIMVKN